ncbi:hypothetical protein [Falsiroseomonas frigidaquae]|uniref:hypothetical protein n=1 Tax=Falsiroseomonas frigidaquae TaxID=487318 RepID=UPI00143AD812|nr:hypothetical protein [Falsiroseomonas frigidaquae]
MAGLLGLARDRPRAWGIPIRMAMGVRYPDAAAISRASGAIHAAHRIGVLLHQRMPQPVCAEARQVVGSYDYIAAFGRGREAPLAPPDGVVHALPDRFISTLAAKVCRSRSPQWAERAAISPMTTVIKEYDSAPVFNKGSERTAFLSRINGATDMADTTAATARQVYGTTICTSLRSWPEMHAADASARAQAHEDERADRWSDVAPLR